MKKHIATRLSLMLSCVLIFGCSKSSDQTAANPSSVPEPALSSAEKLSQTAVEPKQIDGLSLWYKADSIKLKDNSPVTSWPDSGPKDLVLTGTQSNAPLYKQRMINGLPTVRFSSKSSRLEKISWDPLLVNPDSATLAIVLRSNDPQPVNSDNFGIGNCGSNRFNVHLMAANQMIFQMGDPSKFELSAPRPKGWDGKFHIFTVTRKGLNARMAVDGEVVVDTLRFDTVFKTQLGERISIGGLCNNGIKADMAEVIVFQSALDAKVEYGLTKYLSQKYGIRIK